MEVADQVLSLKDAELEINTRKMRQRHLDAFKLAATEGVLSSKLFWLLKGISIMFKSDNRESERLNKQVTLMAERCPTATLELKSARLSLKYMLGHAGEGSTVKPSCKWSDIRPVAEKVRDLCLKGWDSLIDVQSDPFRFAPTQAAADCLPSSKVLYMQSRLNPHLSTHSVSYVWAASYNMLAHKELSNLLESQDAWRKMFPVAFCIASRPADSRSSVFQFYVSAETCWRKHLVLPVLWDSSTRTVSWQSLSGFQPLVLVIKEQYAAVHDGHSVVVMHAALESFGSVETGSISCAKVGKVTKLVKLEKPTKAFVAKAEANAKHNPAKDGKDVAASTGNIDNHSYADKLQTAGLNLLVEEAEAKSKAREGYEEEEDLSDDGADTDEFQHGFAYWTARGVASACAMDEDDDVGLDKFVSQPGREELGEAVSLEERAALKSIDERKFDIGSAEQQAAMHHLQQNPAMDMDPIDAVIECAVASEQGVDAVNMLELEPGSVANHASGSSASGPASGGSLALILGCWHRVELGSLFDELGDDEAQVLSTQCLHPYEDWVAAASASVSLLREQQQQAGLGDSDFNGVSLVAFQDAAGFWKIEFFQWKEEGVSGRVSSLGADNRLKSIVAVGSRREPIVLSQASGQILWRKTCIKVVRSQWKRDQGQSLVPDHLLRLRRMVQVACGLDSQVQPCFICKKTYSPTLPVEESRPCCLCMLASHQKCCDEIVRVFEILTTRSSRLKRAKLSSQDDDEAISHLTLPGPFPNDFSWPWPSPFDRLETVSTRR
eukprot:s1306_g14.t1